MATTKLPYDKDLVRGALVEVCARYLGPARSQGGRAVWTCRGCGKRDKFSAYPKKHAAGCMNTACPVPEKMDAIDVIAYFEGLEPKGAGFVAILKRGYEILGLPEPEAQHLPNRRRRGATGAPRATGQAGGADPSAGPGGGKLAKIDGVPKEGQKTGPSRRPDSRRGDPDGSMGDARSSRRALPRPPTTSGWQADEEPEDRPYAEGSAHGTEGTSTNDSHRTADAEASGPPPHGEGGYGGGAGDEEEIFEGEVVDDDAFASTPSSARDQRAANRRRTRAYAEGSLGYRRPAEAWVVEKGGATDGRDLLDAVYKEILYHCPLVPSHKAYLKGRGLTYDNMAAAQLGSMTKERAKKVKDLLAGTFGKETLLSVPGFSKSQLTGRLSFTLSFECVLIPYSDDAGRVVTIEGRCVGKPPKGLGKYVSLRGAGSHLYVHPAYATDALEAFCEGVMGALVAAQEGIAVGSIQGFRRYKDPEDDGPLPELRGTNYTGSKIAYIPDVDDPPQPEILETAPDTAFHLITRQGGEATIALLPNGKDLDEWLLSMRPSKRRARFTDLVARAVPPERFIAGARARGMGPAKESAAHDDDLAGRRPNAAQEASSRTFPPIVPSAPGTAIAKINPAGGVAAIENGRRNRAAAPVTVPSRGVFVREEVVKALVLLAGLFSGLVALWFAVSALWEVAASRFPNLFSPSPGFAAVLADHSGHLALAALAVCTAVSLVAWNSMRTRRVVKARHLSGELKT